MATTIPTTFEELAEQKHILTGEVVDMLRSYIDNGEFSVPINLVMKLVDRANPNPQERKVLKDLAIQGEKVCRGHAKMAKGFKKLIQYMR